MRAANYWITLGKLITGLSEPKLAEKIGTSKVTLLNARRGITRIPPPASQKLAEITGVPYPYILATVASDSAKTEEERKAWLSLVPKDIAEKINENDIISVKRWSEEDISNVEQYPLFYRLTSNLLIGDLKRCFQMTGKVGDFTSSF